MSGISLRPAPKQFETREDLAEWLRKQNAEVASARDTPREWQIALISLQGGYVSSTGCPKPAEDILIRSCVEQISVIDFANPTAAGQHFLLKPAPNR